MWCSYVAGIRSAAGKECHRPDSALYYYYFHGRQASPQEDFKLYVPAERTVQLASLSACPYTEFAAIFFRPNGFAPSKPNRIYAAERACPPRQPSLTQVISSENFIP